MNRAYRFERLPLDQTSCLQLSGKSTHGVSLSLGDSAFMIIYPNNLANPVLICRLRKNYVFEERDIGKNRENGAQLHNHRKILNDRQTGLKSCQEPVYIPMGLGESERLSEAEM